VQKRIVRVLGGVTMVGSVVSWPWPGRAGPAFADGRHDLGDPDVEGIKFFHPGRVGDEHVSVTYDACPPNPFDGLSRGDVGQWVAGYEHEVRAGLVRCARGRRV